MDTECPYCYEGIEICHDDAYGYSEDDIYEQQCPYCEKNFSFTISYSITYYTEQAPCLNGFGHNFELFLKFTSDGREQWERCSEQWERCSGCWKERKVTNNG